MTRESERAHIMIASNSQLPRGLRPALLGVIALGLCLVVLHVLLYTPMLEMPDAWSFVFAPVALLVIYAGVVLALPRLVRVTDGAEALRVGTRMGLFVAMLEALNIGLESLVEMPQSLVTILTGIFMLSTFTLWGMAGFLAAYRSRRAGIGILAAIWCAMVTMILAITFGYALLVIAWPRLATFSATDPDFLRSHWSDLRAFTIANTLSNGSTHLLEGPIIALAVGSVGALIGMVFARKSAAKTAPR